MLRKITDKDNKEWFVITEETIKEAIEEIEKASFTPMEQIAWDTAYEKFREQYNKEKIAMFMKDKELNQPKE